LNSQSPCHTFLQVRSAPLLNQSESTVELIHLRTHISGGPIMLNANKSARKPATVTLLLSLLLMMLLLAGCAPRPGAGETAAAAGPQDVVIDLPSLALDVAEDGSVSMGGVNISELAAGFGVPLELPITADQVAMLTSLGIQHIQVANEPDGLALLVNGQALPSLAWSKDELANIAQFAPQMPALAELLPILTQLGIGVTLNLPVAEGVERAPLAVSAEESAAAALASSQDEFVASIGELPTISVPVTYADDGTYTVAGMTGDAWASLTGVDLFASLTQRPEQIDFMQTRGIEQVDVHLDPDGLRIFIDGAALPYVDLSEGKLASVIELAKSTGALNIPGLDAATLDTILGQFLPILTSANVDFSLRFPAE
jgi:hypothetical protein